jgi:hypothetical protein
MITRTQIILLVLLLLLQMSAQAGDSEREIRATRVDKPPIVDGKLDDVVWLLAEPAKDFTQLDPVEGAPASERTEIRVLYDGEALYFGCMFYDSDPSGIVARLTRRDNEIDSDRGSIRLDSHHDHRTAYEFTFNAAGVKVDILQYDDAAREDPSWDAVWDLQTMIGPQGWSAELKIPFRVLRYSTGDDSSEQMWGINFIRRISRKQEQDRWVHTPKSQSGFVSRFGHLTGLRQLPSPGNLEILPFVVGKQEFKPATSYQDKQEDFSANAGLDLKYSLTSSFVLDATINPDFGQVEADPAVLNLSTFETFYPERRPFFIEGTQIIRFSTFGDDFGPGMFYSRRIGRAVSPDEVNIPEGGKALSLPQTVSILGAAKVSGKTAGGLSVGVLEAVTAREHAEVEDSSGNVSNTLVEPLSNYSVVRLRQDVMEHSNVGLILTSVAREALRPAVTAGVDWNMRLGQGTHQLTGFSAFSRTTSSSDERVNGSAGKIQMSRIAAEHWLWSAAFDFTSKKYDINDAGFFFRPNDYGAVGTLTYKEDRPSSWYRNYSTRLFVHERRNFDGANLNREAILQGTLLAGNYWGFATGLGLDVGESDDRETRGYGLYDRPSSYSAGGTVATDERDPVAFEVSYEYGWDEKKKRQSGTEIEMLLKPLSWMEWTLETGYVRVRDLEAWVDNVSLADGTTQTIFADRDTDEFGITLRSTLTFTRDLTFQVYGQMLLAKGHYSDFREFREGSPLTPASYSGNPDFNDQFFNMNLVLRWEYLPGSTLFLVWSQAREGGNGNYDASWSENVSGTFDAFPSNVFLLKVSYWLGL